MTAADRARYQQKLLALREEILQAGTVPIEPNRRDDGQTKPDEDEQPLNEMQQAIASGRNRARAGSLGLIEAALRRLEGQPEEFGLCRECEEPIEARRLDLLPYAELCTECQRGHDSHRQPGGRRHLTDYK